MSTGRVSDAAPGTFASKRRCTPSSGWMQSPSTFGAASPPSGVPSAAGNIECGRLLNRMTISEDFSASALPLLR